MTGNTHAICGSITMFAIALTKFSGIEAGGYTYLPAFGMLTVVAGSYLPDIDIPRSKLGRRFKFISKFLTHRGITHTLLIPCLLYLLMSYIATMGILILPELILGLNVGWVCHIVADLFNKKGVPILWPICRQKLHVASFLTSSWHEYVFIVLWLGVNVLCVISLLL